MSVLGYAMLQTHMPPVPLQACANQCPEVLRVVGAAGLPKLNDANNAGTKNSQDCTLILTEGDSAMSLAVAGLAVIGRDSYGVFPLRYQIVLNDWLPTLFSCELTEYK